MMQVFSCVGRMTRDPELRETQSGVPVCSFTVAVDRMTKKEGGQNADFITVTVWNKTAENVVKYCAKGSLVGVRGEVRSRNYEKDGKKVYTVEVVADQIKFLDNRKKEDVGGTPPIVEDLPF